jgi:hypothetical protein
MNILKHDYAIFAFIICMLGLPLCLTYPNKLLYYFDSTITNTDAHVETTINLIDNKNPIADPETCPKHITRPPPIIIPSNINDV